MPTSTTVNNSVGYQRNDSLVLSVANLNQSLNDKILLENNYSYNTIDNSNNYIDTSQCNTNHSVQYYSNSSNLVSNNPFYSNETNQCESDIETTKSVIHDSEEDKVDESSADLHIIAHVSNLVSVQIDHYQYLFLLRLSEEVTELATFLSLDSNRILQTVRLSLNI